MAYGAPEGVHAHTPVLISSTQAFAPVGPPPFFAPGPFFAQPQVYPSPTPVFAPSPVFSPAGHSPVFVSAPPQFQRPTFVFWGNPNVRPVVATTPAPAATTAATLPPATTEAPVESENKGSIDYNYQYGVNDAQSGVNLGQTENQDGMLSISLFFLHLSNKWHDSGKVR